MQMSPDGCCGDGDRDRRAPLIETTTSTLGGNIDPRQMAELPANGRNWIGLAMLAPGSRTDPVAGTREDSEKPLPDRNNNETREFQLNVDGQQVTSEFGTGGQPRYSADSIAEFQFISNRFDATQGRSAGVQVNAITKSGTNQLSGCSGGNFRDSRFNSAESGSGPSSSRSTTSSTARRVGGPILRDRLHFFANYEYEREPRTSHLAHAVPVVQRLAGGDEHPEDGRRAPGLSTLAEDARDGQGGRRPAVGAVRSASATNHPASTNTTEEYNDEILGQFTQVLSNRALNEIKVGKTAFGLVQRESHARGRTTGRRRTGSRPGRPASRLPAS